MVQVRVDAINAESCDDEQAHCDEDILYEDVLRAIADGTAEDPKLCAFVALSTLEIEFSRWYA
jgi:hypothetical protein